MSGKSISVEAYVFLDNSSFEEVFPSVVPVGQDYGDSRENIRAFDCCYCGQEGGTVDHFVPLSKDGPDQLQNLVPACRDCNMEKSALHPLTWLRILLVNQDARAVGLGKLLGPDLEQQVRARIGPDIWQPYQVWPVLA